MLRDPAGVVNGARRQVIDLTFGAPCRYPLQRDPASVIWILQSCLSVNPLTEDMGDGHDYNGKSSYTVVSPRLARRPGRAVAGAGPDPWLPVPFPGDSRHRGPGGVSLRQRHRDDLPGEDRRRTRALHRPGQLPGAVQ